MLRILASLVILLTPQLVFARSLANRLAEHPHLVDASKDLQKGDLQVELRYATANNFMRKNVYGDLRACYLRKKVAKQLHEAVAALKKLRPDLRLRVYDCARPLAVQHKMWALVRGTPSARYVANPAKGSMHNTGCAVDVTLATKQGAPLDMGTSYDYAGPLAQPRLERRYLIAGKLKPSQLSNRLLLRHVMVEAGFLPLAIEWWHFDCTTPKEARRRGYRAIP